MTYFEEGDTVYLPDGTKGEVMRVSEFLSSSDHVAVRVMYWNQNGDDIQGLFLPEQLHHRSFDERLRRIEKRLGLDD